MKIDLEKLAIKVTEKVLDDLLYKGKTLREWIDLIIKFEKEYKVLPMGKYPATISGCNMEEDKPKEVFGYNEYKDIRETLVGLTIKGYTSEMIKTVLEQMQGTVKQKTKDIRFICNSCRNKYRCEHCGFVKEFIEQDPDNRICCQLYVEEQFTR